MLDQYLPEGMGFCREALPKTPTSLEKAMQKGRILEAPVTLCDSRMRLHVDLGCMEGLIEAEEGVWCRPGEVRKDIAVISRVGKPVAFKILSIEEKNGTPVAILSRKAAQKECMEQLLKTVSPGDILPARVTHLEPFGAFLDIGCGVSSLLSVDCISVSRISHPRERVREGDEIWVAVKSIDPAAGRIYTTLKELLGSWEECAAAFSVGQTVSGRIASVESYGVFVELAPNLAGLAELRESDADSLKSLIGKRVAVYIKSILPARMKIKLVIVDTCPTPCAVKKLKYYIDPLHTKHLSRWQYSPAEAARVIETVFD